MYMYVYALIVCTLLLGGNKGIYLSIFIVCQNTHLGISGLQRVKRLDLLTCQSHKLVRENIGLQ